MKTIFTDKAPAAVGPYSQAKVVGGLLFASGQIPLNWFHCCRRYRRAN